MRGKAAALYLTSKKISPRIFFAFSRPSDELMDIPHVIRSTIITAAGGKTAVNSKKKKGGGEEIAVQSAVIQLKVAVVK